MCIILAAFCAAVCAQLPTPLPMAGMAPAVVQANGDVVTVPSDRPASRRSGLMLSIDTRWVNSYGYKPVEVTITSPMPATSNRLVTIRLHTGWEVDTAVEQDFELPIGSTQASATVPMPIYNQTSNIYWWDVWVDGVKDLDLSVKKDDTVARSGNAGSSTSTVRILIPGSNANNRSLMATGVADFEVMTLSLKDFPRRWIDYTCLDVVSLSLSDLEALPKANPAAFEALLRWVRSGGQFWATDIGDDFAELARASKVLQVPETRLTTVADVIEGDKPAPVGWRPARFRGGIAQGQSQGFSDSRTGRTRWVNDPRVIAALDRDPNFVRTGQATENADGSVPRTRAADSSEWFVEQRLGLGMLRAFRGVNEAAWFGQGGPAANMAAITNGDSPGQIPRALSMGLRATRRWDARQGLIPDGSSPDFAKLWVPGVGRAPVTEFQILITLFVLIIGPLNYWLLKRYKRLQLIVLSVPIAAALATGALFIYAIAADGFDTSVRVRSYTTIDQRNGEAACWARLSYYSGIAPTQGLTMPADVAVYPLLPGWSTDGWLTERAMMWDVNEAKLTRGWLTSRTPTQYLFQRSRKTPHRIDVTAGAGKMQITNRLGTRIESLIAIDDEGKFFTGEGFEKEQRAVLEPISRTQAVQLIVPIVRDNEPESPAEFAGSERDFRMGRRRGYMTRYRPQISSDQLAENLASRAITDLAGLNGRPALDLPPRSYVAVTETGPEVETGIPYAKEKASFHVIVGRF
jgi:hypothetical protein